jgi:hypothetical protein
MAGVEAGQVLLLPLAQAQQDHQVATVVQAVVVVHQVQVTPPQVVLVTAATDLFIL